MTECKYHLCSNAAEYGAGNFCSKQCKNKYHVRQTRYNNKMKAIDLLGGACTICAFDKHPAALQFHHHLGEKNFGLSTGTGWARAWSKILKELELCELICANCHSIEHYKNENFVV